MNCQRSMETDSHTAARHKHRIAALPAINKFLFLLLAVSFLPTANAGYFDCTSATWGEWGSWTTCPSTADGTDSTIVAKRTRTCTKSPWYCTSSISCDGELSQTLVCGTTTTKQRYSTIVFGTTMGVEETTTDGDVTTSTAAETTTSASETSAAVTTTTDASVTTVAAATTTASGTSASATTDASATSKASATSDASATTADATTDASATTKASATSASATTDASATSKSSATSDSASTASATTASGTTNASATTKSSETSDSATTASATTAASATSAASATTDGSDTTAAAATTASATTAASATSAAAVVTSTSAVETTVSASSRSNDGTSGSSSKDTTLDFTFATNPSGSEEATTVSGESTDSTDECATPVTTVSTMAPGTMGTLFPGSGGSGGFGPYTFATETPTPMAGVSRSPACRTTPVITTTIQFKTCTMIPVSSTSPMISTSTVAMETSTSASVVSTTLEKQSTTAEESSTEAATSTEASASSDSASTESATSTEASASSDAASTDSASTESATSEASATSDSASTADSATSTEASASSESATSEEPSASSDAATTLEASASSESAASSESPSATTNEPSGSSDAAESTSSVEETTIASSSWTTCNDCSQINVQLFDGQPYEDASSVLNRYSASGCYYVQFFCRPIEIGDTSPVSTILSGDTSYLGAALSANLACRDKKWVLLGSNSSLASSVTSLGCVYAAKTTTTTTRKPTTTTIPGIDLSNPCMNCTNLVVSQTTFPEGVTYLDHTLDKCLSVEAHCVPINGKDEVWLMYNNQGILESGSTVNRTFSCNKKSQWVDTTTNNIISNISCVMIPGTTTPLTLSTLPDLPSTPENQPTKESAKPATVKVTTPDSLPPEEVTTPSGAMSTAESELTTAQDIPSTVGQVVTKEDEVTEVMETTTALAVCNNCEPLEPLALTKSGTYNGMLVLWHYRQNGCYRVSISCQATISETDVATLYYNSNTKVMSGVGEQAMDLVCNNGQYLYNGKPVSTVSCLAISSAVVPATTLPPMTTPAPGDDCSGCNRLPVVILGASSTYTNGLLKATTSYASCMSVQLTCYGTSSTDQVALIYADAPLATGTGNVNLTLSCNTAGTWITGGLQTVESISCGYIPLAITTTAVPTACGKCANMESAQALLQTGTYDGMIVLYNYVDAVTKCKKVDISCQGTTSSENATLLFDPIGAVLTGTDVHEIKLNCSADGTWKYSGTVIESVSCIVSMATKTVTPATTTEVVTTTTSLNPSIPMCAQCSRLAAVPVSSIDDSLQNGFTTMIFSTSGSCSTVQVTCSGGTSTERVTLLAATTSLVSGVGSVSFNFTCNSGASWMTAAGTIVDSLACGRYNLTTTTTTTPVPTTTTPTTTPTTPTTPTTTTSTASMTQAPSQCSKCANMMAKAVHPTDGSYDGMIVMSHYADTTGCRHVDISCGPTMNTENATIIFGSTIVATGATTHAFSLTCDPNANWVYQSTSVSTVSCVISTAADGVTVAPTTSTTKATIDDTVSACSQCGRAPIVSVGGSSTYLNGFTTIVQSTDSLGCSVLSIKCQGSTTADAVAILSAGMPYSSGFGAVSINLTCDAESQWIGKSDAVITSLACGHKNAVTTVSATTTVAATGQCTSCANMLADTVSTSGSYDGMVVMDHFIDPKTKCRALTVTCAPTVATENATLFFDSTAVATGSTSHTLALACNPSAEWTYDGTVVSKVGCSISTGTGVTESPVTTTAPITNPAINLCSQCARLSVQSVDKSSGFLNGFTTLSTTINSFGCTTVTMMCQGVTTSDSVAIVINGNYAVQNTGSADWNDFSCNSQGSWTSTQYGDVTSVICQRADGSNPATTTAVVATTTTAVSLCNSCPDIRPRSQGSGDYYDGMIVINHYTERTTRCRKATVDCMTTMDNEVAQLYLDSEVINTDSAVGVNLECSSAGTWTYDSKTYSTTSCLVANSSSLLPSTGKKRRKRQAGTGETACQSCNTLPLTSLRAFYPYMNGFSTISMDDSTTCMTATAACEGTTSTDTVAWIASGTVLETGTQMINMTFVCNSLSSWETSSGSVFSTISCGRQYATTTVATTTVASQALNCPNLVSAPLTSAELGENESNGQLILDHFVNTTIMSRQVTITCYGNSATDNTTVSFNGGSTTMSDSGETQLTLTCSSSGQWIKNGVGVQTVACIVTATPGSTIPLTTTIPTTPTTSAGSLANTNCARNVMLTIPNGYNAGYLSMNTISTETSLELVMSCAAPTGISESMLLSSTGDLLTTGTPNTNMTLTCNSDSQWVVSSASGTGISIGTVITSIACVVSASTTTVTAVTVAAGCQQCPNLPAIGLQTYQLDANERNGQFIVDHVNSPNACRVVYLSCAGTSASENSTILFNSGSDTLTNQGITSTTVTCTASSTWDWYGTSIGSASCKVADRALTTATTAPYVLPGDTGLACSRSSLINPLISGDAGAYLVLDTTIVNGGLSTTLSCAAPDNSATAVATNGDGSVLGESSNGLINMTLTCNSNSQWILSAISSSTSGTSAALGTVVDGLKCGEVPAATTTTTTIATTTTPSDACQKCVNMQAIALTSSELVPGASNGQLLLSHSVDPSSKCRIVVIKCRGDNTNQNATIFFNANGQTLSAMYGAVSTSMACSQSNTWQRSGSQIDGVACMITSVTGATSPSPITTVAPSVTTESASGPSASCNSAFTTAVSASGYTSGFMIVDTTTVGSTMTAAVSCAAPVSTQTAALIDSTGSQVSSNIGSTNLTLTCNSNSQWVTSSGTVISSLSCGTVAPTTLAAVVATTAAAATADCSTAVWNEWKEWSDCTDTCGSCGTHQRFRSCNKPLDTCTCTGSAYEKENCNLAVCKFPKASCCTGFTPRSSGGTFVCIA